MRLLDEVCVFRRKGTCFTGASKALHSAFIILLYLKKVFKVDYILKYIYIYIFQALLGKHNVLKCFAMLWYILGCDDCFELI